MTASPVSIPADAEPVTDGSPAPSPRRRPLVAVLLATVLGLMAALVAVPQAASATVRLHGTTRYERSIERKVLAQINSQRHAHHLASVTMNSHLILSARRHNYTMARHNAMSHQLPGEAYFATRISRAGYKWHQAGENIGWNSRMNTPGVQALQRAMYNEKAPNDGHRRNILNRNYRNVGVDVFIDKTHHKIWLTTDYGRH